MGSQGSGLVAAYGLGQRRRTAVVAAVVALGASLVMVALIVAATLHQATQAAARVEFEGTDVVVRVDAASGAGPASAALSQEDLHRLGEVTGVDSVVGLTRGRAALLGGTTLLSTVVESTPTEAHPWQRVVSGALPQEGTQVALSREAMRAAHVHVGDTVVLGSQRVGESEFSVVGEVDTRGALTLRDDNYALVTQPVAQALAHVDGATEARLTLAPDADPKAVIDAINRTVPVGWPQATGEIITAAESLYGVGLGVLAGIINSFAWVAALLAVVVVVAVTWAGLPERRREYAALRLVGATQGQLLAAVCIESTAVALLGAALAVPLALGLSALAIPLLGLIPGMPALSWRALVVPAGGIVGVVAAATVVGLVAGLVPALTAARQRPAAAVRSAATPPAPHRAAFPVAIGLVVITLVALAAAGMVLPVVGVAVCGVVALVVVAAALPALIQGVAGMVERRAERTRPETELSAQQLRAFPGRSAAVGVAVVVIAVVVAACGVIVGSISATTRAYSVEQPGPQLMAGAPAGGPVLGQQAIAAVSAVPGIDRVVPVATGQATLTGPAAPGPANSGPTTTMITQVTGGTAEDFAQASPENFPLHSMATDALYLPTSQAAPFKENSWVSVSGPKGKRQLRAVYVEGLPFSAFVHSDTLRDIGVELQPHALWLSLAHTAHRGEVISALQAISAVTGQLPITGAQVTNARVDSLVRTATLAAGLMLACAAVIAVLGAAVVVATGLRERSQDFAMLRLLGMGARQLRASVSAEIIAMSAAAALSGVLLGFLWGSGIVAAAARSLGVAPHIRIPVLLAIGCVVLLVVAIRAATATALDKISWVSPAAALRTSLLGAHS